MRSPVPGLLSSLTVIDLTTQLPGPYCSMILADFGATVIKIEPPGGDPLREFPPMFASVNRGKQSLSVDLKTDEGKTILGGLFKQADIVLEGFRPGVAERIGGDYATAHNINPSIIYCSISGFGQEGPYRNRAGHDINYLSLGGVLGQAERAKGRPIPPPVLVSDMASGMYAALAVLAALEHRRLTGRGQYIDLSMTESAVSWMAPEIARAHEKGEAPERPILSGLPHYDSFETADGRFISLGIVYEPHFWRRLCEALNVTEWRELTTEDRMRRCDEIRSRLKEIFRTATRAEWDRRLQAADVPCGPVYALHELASDPQLRHRGVFRDMTDSLGVVSRQVLPPYRFSDTPVEPSMPPPVLGEHTEEILRNLGYAEDTIKRLEESSAVFQA